MQVTEQMLYIYYYYYYCCYFDTIIHPLKRNLHRVGRDSQRARPAKKVHVGSCLCGVVPTMCFLLCCTVLVFFLAQAWPDACHAHTCVVVLCLRTNHDKIFFKRDAKPLTCFFQVYVLFFYSCAFSQI